MKKKIINGILMVALVAATSTSFVSCKDTNEDVQAEMQAEYASLLGRLNQLEGYDLDGRVKTLETKVKNHAGDIATLQAEIDALELWILEAFSNLIYTPQIAGTYNNLTGEIELPGVNPMMLLSYYGTAGETCEKFPENSNLLKDGQMPIFWVANDKLGQGSGNMVESGHLYAAINRYVDTTPMLAESQKGLFDFSLVQTDGTKAPVKIENCDENGDPTSDVLTWGWTRAESNVYKFDVTFTGDDAEGYKATIDLKNLKEDIKGILKGLKNKDKKELGKSLAELYYNVLTKDTKLPKYALKISWEDPTDIIKTVVDNANDEYTVNVDDADGDIIKVGKETKEKNDASFKVTSNYDILFATVKPMGFKSGQALAENAGKITNGINKTFESLESLENKIFNKIKAQFPNFNPINFDLTKGILKDGAVYYISLDNEATPGYQAAKATLPSGDISGDIDITNLIVNMDLNVNNGIASVNEMFAQMNKLKEKLNGKTITNWVEKFTSKFDKLIENNADQLLQPVLLAIDKDGNVNRVSGSEGAPYVADGEVILKPTTYNAEFLAPAYAKVLGCKDIKENGFNEMIYVNDKEIKFTPESGKTYEITYEAVDFLGNMFKHKYYIQGK